MDQILLYKTLWPALLLGVWLAAEVLCRFLSVPRSVSYAIGGYLIVLFGYQKQMQVNDSFSLLASIALGLILFDLGYRINLRWFKNNFWLLILGILEAAAIFVGTYYTLTLVFDLSMPTAFTVASLCISTSPVVILRISRDLKAAGQVTERMFHLSALNCLMSALLLMISLGYEHSLSVDWQAAVFSTAKVFLGAGLLGGVFGVMLPLLFVLTKPSKNGATIISILNIVFLVNLCHAFGFSPLIAALFFGVVARKYRVVLAPIERNFGVFGEMLAMFLLVYVATLLTTQGIVNNLLLGGAILLVRAFIRLTLNTLFAHVSGITYKKGFYTGLSLMPFSAFAILLLEQSKYGAVSGFALLAGLVFMLDIIGPYCTTLALKWAKETNNDEGV